LPRSSSKLTPTRITILIIVVIAILVFERLAFSNIDRPEWVFDGAYGNYYGTGELLDGTPYTYNLTLAVLAYNSSEAQILTKGNLTQGSMFYYNESANWVNLNESPINPGVTGRFAYTTNSTLLNIDGKDIQVTAAYYLNAFTTNGVNVTDVVTVFSNQSVGFPVGVRISYNGGEMTTYLTKTNIPGLMP